MNTSCCHPQFTLLQVEGVASIVKNQELCGMVDVASTRSSKLVLLIFVALLSCRQCAHLLHVAFSCLEVDVTHTVMSMSLDRVKEQRFDRLENDITSAYESQRTGGSQSLFTHVLLPRAAP